MSFTIQWIIYRYMVTVVNQSVTDLMYFLIGAVTLLYMLHSIVNMDGGGMSDG